MHFCGGSLPCSQAINVARLMPSIAAVRRSFSFDSLLYRPNAFKTSSVVISAGRLSEKVGAFTVRSEKIGSDPGKAPLPLTTPTSHTLGALVCVPREVLHYLFEDRPATRYSRSHKGPGVDFQTRPECDRFAQQRGMVQHRWENLFQ
jgi:hypothetical protein